MREENVLNFKQAAIKFNYYDSSLSNSAGSAVADASQSFGL
jgi:hypothetical protein